MKRLQSLLFLIVFLIWSNHTIAQIFERSGNIFDDISMHISTMPIADGDEYTTPSNDQLNLWEQTLERLIQGDYMAAATMANELEYSLVQFTDTLDVVHRTYYILENASTNHWGSFVYNPDFCRSIVIQAPHAKKDSNTGHQGIHIFRETEAMFYQVNGTNRCNSSSLSLCTGTTSNCTGAASEAYRISDLAHTTESLFQKTTEVLANTSPDIHFIQLHGFTKQDTDPFVILSNGTQALPNTDLLSRLADNLLLEDSVLTFKIAHIDIDWTRLRGFWNTQGRVINNSKDVCNEDSAVNSGRFFHIEQERTRLRSDVTGWDKMANALSNTFDCNFVSSTYHAEVVQQLNLYPNPVTNVLHIELPDPNQTLENVQVYNFLGQNMREHLSLTKINLAKTRLHTELLPNGYYFIKWGDFQGVFLKN